jgi:pilus assembly protein Flp/PilA
LEAAPIGWIANPTVTCKGETHMKRLNESILALRVWKDTRGQDLVEYALAAGLVAVAAVACMPGLSGTVNNVFTKIGSIINSSVQ